MKVNESLKRFYKLRPVALKPLIFYLYGLLAAEVRQPCLYDSSVVRQAVPTQTHAPPGLPLRRAALVSYKPF